MGDLRVVDRRRATRAGVAAAPVAFAGLLATQALAARRAEYLPRDPGYRIDALVDPDGRATDPAPPLRLAMLGDSTVAGVGSPTAAEALPMLVAERLAALLARPVHVTGFGVSGARTAHLSARQLARALAVAPDVIVAVVGSNDVTHLTPPWKLRRDLETLAARVRAATGAPLVLAGVPRFARLRALGEPLASVAGAYAWMLRAVQRRVAAAHGIAFVDRTREIGRRFATAPQSLSPDGFHPGPVGYGFWADAIAPVVVGALRTRDRAAQVAEGGSRPRPARLE